MDPLVHHCRFRSRVRNTAGRREGMKAWAAAIAWRFAITAFSSVARVPRRCLEAEPAAPDEPQKFFSVQSHGVFLADYISCYPPMIVLVLEDDANVLAFIDRASAEFANIVAIVREFRTQPRN